MSGFGPFERWALEKSPGPSCQKRLLPIAHYSGPEVATDDKWRKAAEKMQREDPAGERSSATLREMGL
jgi:hypothetical protein